MLVSYALFGATACNDDKEQAAKLAEVQRIADEKLKKAEAAANGFGAAPKAAGAGGGAASAPADSALSRIILVSPT